MSAICNKDNWKLECSCICSSYFKDHMCKHIIGLVANQEHQYVRIPNTAKQVPIGKKPSRGLPRKVPLALNREVATSVQSTQNTARSKQAGTSGMQ